jgi:hypothetical protein
MYENTNKIITTFIQITQGYSTIPKPERKMSLGRPRSRRGNKINIYIVRVCGLHSPQYMKCAFVNMVMNMQGGKYG